MSLLKSLSRENFASRLSTVEPDHDILESYTACFGTSLFFEDSTFEHILRARTLIDQLLREDQTLELAVSHDCRAE